MNAVVGRGPGTAVRGEQVTQDPGLRARRRSDSASLEPSVDRILAAHPDIVAEIRAGKDRKFQFLVGQVMKETKGKADPKIVTDLLRRAIEL